MDNVRMLGSLLTSDHRARARLTGRLAAFLFVASGLLALLTIPLPGPADVDRAGEFVVSVCALALGYATWALAWGLTRLGRTEARLQRSQEDYKQAFQSTRQYAEAYQRQMEVAERTKSGDRIRDTFLQAVSHDLRSPLTAILGSASTLEQGGG